MDFPGENMLPDWFFLLMDEPFLEIICREMNKYAFEQFCGLSKMEKTDHSKNLSTNILISRI